MVLYHLMRSTYFECMTRNFSNGEKFDPHLFPRSNIRASTRPGWLGSACSPYCPESYQTRDCNAWHALAAWTRRNSSRPQGGRWADNDLEGALGRRWHSLPLLAHLYPLESNLQCGSGCPTEKGFGSRENRLIINVNTTKIENEYHVKYSQFSSSCTSIWPRKGKQ